jgi:hypothetical protein
LRNLQRKQRVHGEYTQRIVPVPLKYSQGIYLDPVDVTLCEKGRLRAVYGVCVAYLNRTNNNVIGEQRYIRSPSIDAIFRHDVCPRGAPPHSGGVSEVATPQQIEISALGKNFNEPRLCVQVLRGLWRGRCAP